MKKMNRKYKIKSSKFPLWFIIIIVTTIIATTITVYHHPQLALFSSVLILVKRKLAQLDREGDEDDNK